MLCVLVFALAFPAGAALAWQAYSLSHNGDTLGAIRIVVAGIFVYMALFEMSPPHAHGRLVNLRYASVCPYVSARVWCVLS